MPAKKRRPVKKAAKKKARKVGSHHRPRPHAAPKKKRKGAKVTVRKDGKVSIGALTIPQARKHVEEKLAWELLARESARNKTERNKAAKRIKALKSADKKLKDL